MCSFFRKKFNYPNGVRSQFIRIIGVLLYLCYKDLNIHCWDIKWNKEINLYLKKLGQDEEYLHFLLSMGIILWNIYIFDCISIKNLMFLHSVWNTTPIEKVFLQQVPFRTNLCLWKHTPISPFYLLCHISTGTIQMFKW